MYRIPSEFIRQKTTIVGPITMQHALGLLAGYLLGQALGGSTLVTIVGLALCLAATTVRVQGLALYRFAPLAFSFLIRKLTDDTIDPEEAGIAPPTMTIGLFDADGTPIIFQEEA